MTIYNDLTRAIKEHDEQFQPKPIRQRGQLGYTVNNTYSVVEPTDTAQYRVRLDNKSFVTAYHNGRCAPQPDLSVWVIQDELGRYFVESVDVTNVSSTNPNNPSQAFTAPHSHGRGSGMEFPIDPRLLSPFQIRPFLGLQVYVNGGAYQYEGKWNWFGGDTVDLTTSVPGTAGKQRWAILLLDHATSSITVKNGVLQGIASPLTLDQIETEILKGYPIGAVRLRYGQVSITETDMEALHVLVGDYPRHNFTATTAPNANDDINDGYNVDSRWYDQVGQVLYTCFDATAGAAIWVAAGSGGAIPITTSKKEIKTRVLLYQETLGSAGTFDVDISGFEACDDLEIQMYLRTVDNNTIELFWTANNDTTATNYRRQMVQGANATAGATGDQTRNIGVINGANSVASVFSLVNAEIKNYRNTSRYKFIETSTNTLTASNSGVTRYTNSIWLNTSAINRLAFAPTSGNFQANSSLEIWGVKYIEVVTEVSGVQTELFPIELDYEEIIPTNRQIVLSHVNIVDGGDLVVNGVVVFVGDEE